MEATVLLFGERQIVASHDACVDGPRVSRADGRRVGAGSGAIMCPALRCGIMTAGPDGFRERTLNSHAVSQCTLASSGVFRSSDRPITIFG